LEKIKSLIKLVISKLFTKEIIFYLIFGVCTTLVNIGMFYVLTTFAHLEENISNVIAIITAVVFAYLTNRKLVFNSTAKGPYFSSK